MSSAVLVDGDPIVYRVGFAAQHAVIHAMVETPDARLLPWRFEGKADRNAWKEEHEGYEIVSEEEELEVEPLPFVLQTVKQCLAPLEALGDCRIYLTGERNFREKLATIVPYKAGRRDKPRPVNYQAIRDYLTNNRDALVINGREADDEISIQASRLRKERRAYCVATIDKDLDQIPGRHYDYAKHIGYTVSAKAAEKWFWIQALAGDPTDSIPGCWKVGPGKAEKLVDGWYLDKLPQDQVWTRVVDQYALSKDRNGCPYADKDPRLVALETARLVYMQKEAGELWNPPGIPFGRVEGDDDDA